jgi:hypothetical protein
MKSIKMEKGENKEIPLMIKILKPNFLLYIFFEMGASLGSPGWP